MSVTAFYRSYVADGKRSNRVTRVHIVAEDHRPRRRAPSRKVVYSLCLNAPLADVTRSTPVEVKAPYDLPAGLTWCPRCVSRLLQQPYVVAPPEVTS